MCAWCRISVNPKGFTLFEMLVSTAIMLLMGLLLLGIYRQSHRAYRHGSAHLTTQEEARMVLMKITQALRQATPPSPLDPAVSSPPVGQTASTATFFQPVSVLGGGFDPRNPAYREMALRWRENQVELYEVGSASPAELLSRQVSSVSFQRTADTSLKVVVTQREVIRDARGSAQTIQSQAEATLYFPKP